MRLAISNIAWDISEDEQILDLLVEFQVDAIDVAPSKYFPNATSATPADITRVRDWWADRGIEITGMQSLLFGTKGLNLFGPRKVQDAMLRHLGEIFRIAAGLGATRLVFGSPRNRDRAGLTDQEATEAAVPVFRRLGDMAEFYGIKICLEPNPTRYGANFMTTSEETEFVVRAIAHSSIKMQLDTGALAINRENAASVIERCADLIGHIHASEPDLVPLGDNDTDHAGVHDALIQHLPGHLVSIEMKATANEPHELSVERALRKAVRSYRPRVGEAGP